MAERSTPFEPLARQSNWLIAAVVATAVTCLTVGSAERVCAGEKTPETVTLETVTLIVDYGDGVQKRLTDVAWRDGTTVLDVLKFAQRHPRGITFSYRGSQATALLTKIDDLENQGGRGLNWIYQVNGKLADRSFAIFQLQAGDTILWKFDRYR
jgi:hypothetical protein